MEVFTIDITNNRKLQIIERYESFIWTDRYAASGDFVLKAQPTPFNIDHLQEGAFLGFDMSDRLMRIETTTISKDQEGRKVLTVAGRSLESVLDGRIAKKELNGNPWEITGSIGSVISQMVNVVCVAGTGIAVEDVIPNLVVQNNTTSNDEYLVDVKPGTLYSRIKELCDAYDLGFKITYLYGDPQLTFLVYEGNNRTGINGVVFSEKLENLSETTYFKSLENYKTTAYVIGKNASLRVASDGTSYIPGFDRRVLLVDATDIDAPEGPDLFSALRQRGEAVLSEHRPVVLYDGVVDPRGIYKYGEDYQLGDLVDFQTDLGDKQIMRVTEYIWSHDSQGLSAYPTLANVGGVSAEEEMIINPV